MYSKSKSQLMIFRLFVLIILCIPGVFVLSACAESNNYPEQMRELTEIEVIAQAKNKLINKFSTTNIYTDISLPSHYEIESKYNVYIVWNSSDNNVINKTSGKVTRTLSNQVCTLMATLTYKTITDSIDFQLVVPANIYEDTTNGFSLSKLLEIKPSYLAIKDDLQIKIKLVNNTKDDSIIITGIKSMTISIYNNKGQYLFKNFTYNSNNKEQYKLTNGKCIELPLPAISINSLSMKYLTSGKYYCEYKDLKLYTTNNRIITVGNEGNSLGWSAA